MKTQLFFKFIFSINVLVYHYLGSKGEIEFISINVRSCVCTITSIHIYNHELVTRKIISVFIKLVLFMYDTITEIKANILSGSDLQLVKNKN